LKNKKKFKLSVKTAPKPTPQLKPNNQTQNQTAKFTPCSPELVSIIIKKFLEEHDSPEVSIYRTIK